MDTATEVKARKSTLSAGWRPTITFDGFHPTLRARVLFPYALLAIVLTITTTYLVSDYMVRVLRAHQDAHLEARAQVVGTQIARLVNDHVALWNALSSADTSSRRTALQAQSVSSANPLLPALTSVYVVAADGKTSGFAGSAQAGGSEWSWVESRVSLEGQPASGIRLSSGGHAYYTAGWVSEGADGADRAILILATPLEAILQDIAVSTLAGITLYDAAGSPVVTTVGRSDRLALGLGPAELEALGGGGDSASREVTLDGRTYQQQVEPLPINNTWEGVSYLGISMVEDPIGRDVARARLIIVAALLVTVAGTAVVARHSTNAIERPLQDLMTASQQVASGDLDVQVDIRSADELGQLSESFNAMVRQLRQRRALENLLGRYVGDNIAQRLLDGDTDLSGRRVWATSLFADIRDFSAFTQKVDLSELLDELNEYYETMQRVIDAHGGVVNKFGGDSILAVFGAPLPAQDHASRAIQAAVEMMDELSKLNSQRLMRGVAPIRIGIGVNTGEMIEGNLGSEKRREYTVLGDSVNLAKRLSDLNKETPFDTVFVGEATLKALHEASRWQIDDLGFVMVKGQVEPIRIFSVMHRTDLS